jgi:hypothetical protein
MAGTNGTPVIVPAQADREPYRPTASTQKVHDEIARSLGQIVFESAHQATQFVTLFEHYDRDATTAIRYGHLVDWNVG